MTIEFVHPTGPGHHVGNVHGDGPPWRRGPRAALTRLRYRRSFGLYATG
jgi:hypothetical protein